MTGRDSHRGLSTRWHDIAHLEGTKIDGLKVHISKLGTLKSTDMTKTRALVTQMETYVKLNIGAGSELTNITVIKPFHEHPTCTVAC